MKTLEVSTDYLRKLIASYNEIRYYMINHKCKEEDIQKLDAKIQNVKEELERRN